MKFYDTFIFDLDGTLLDTIGDLTNAVNYALKNYDYPQKTIPQIKSYVGDGIPKLIERAIPQGLENKNYNDVLKLFSDYYNSHLTDCTHIYDDIITVFEKLKEKNCKIAIVSNKSDKYVKILSEYFFKNYVDIAIGESENIRKKPSSDMANYALSKLSKTTDTSVYIGDSEVDILTAKNSSLPCISVSWGFRSKEFLEKNGANIIIDSPLEILKYI
ncbi:MAG: HAD family hydrolase [Peptoanaerobacter stomatis]